MNLLRAALALYVTLGALPALAQPADPVLRVCADPQNLPFSNQAGEGFENRIAQELARDLGKTTVEYTWFPQRMGFVRQTLRSQDDVTHEFKCDVIIGVPKGYELTLTTQPYMRSIYALVAPGTDEYRKLKTRLVDLHPMTIIQNARTSGGGVVTSVPTQALSVGPVETWKAEKVSIWHAGKHDNPFGQRLTTLMISKRVADTAVPMSLLGGHPNVQFNFYRGGIGTCEVEMH